MTLGILAVSGLILYVISLSVGKDSYRKEVGDDFSETRIERLTRVSGIVSIKE